MNAIKLGGPPAPRLTITVTTTRTFRLRALCGLGLIAMGCRLLGSRFRAIEVEDDNENSEKLPD